MKTLYIYREDSRGDSFDLASGTDLATVRSRADYYMAHLTRSELKHTDCYIVGFNGFGNLADFYDFCEQHNHPAGDYYESLS